MELEIYEALIAVNVPADKAKAAAESVKREIDGRYSLHAAQLATRGDVAEVKTSVESVRREVAEAKAEMVKWFVGTIIAVGGITAALLKLMI